MFSRHISAQLAGYLDGQLSPQEARQADLHLQGCAECRAEHEQIKRGMAMVEHLPLVEAPAALWSSIEAAYAGKQWRDTRVLYWSRWALAAAIVLALAGGAFWRLTQPLGPRWEVSRLDGSPLVDAKPIHGVGHIAVREW